MKNEAKKTGDLLMRFIPKRNKDDTERFLSVNGRRMLVQTNVEVWLPREFAEVLDNSLAAEREAMRYIESVESK